MQQIKPGILMMVFAALSVHNAAHSQIKDVKYGLIKKVKINWYDSSGKYSDSIFSTIYQLNNCDLFNITLQSDGRLNYNNKSIGKWQKHNDSTLKFVYKIGLGYAHYDNLSPHNEFKRANTGISDIPQTLLSCQIMNPSYITCLVQGSLKYRVLIPGIWNTGP